MKLEILENIVKTEHSNVGSSLVDKGIPSPERNTILVTEKVHFENLWELHDPNSNAPEVDFDKYSVIWAYMGMQTNQGYELEITKVEETDKGIHVYIREYDWKNPLAGSSNPLHVVKVDKLRKPIIRIVREENSHYQG